MGEITINPIHNVHKKYRTMNLVNSYIFTPPITYNTYIGGISSSVSSATLLASKLGISVGAISNFAIVGSDIKCKITGSYVIPNGAFLANTAITSYIDTDGLVTDIGVEAFKDVTLLKEIDFKGIISLTGTAVFRTSSINKVSLENCTTLGNSSFSSSGNIKLIYIPRCTSLGSSVGDNLVFNVVTNEWNASTVYVPIALQTVNSGSPDGDLTFFISKNGTVRYVSSFASPNQITDLTVNPYNTSLQLNFTIPSSTNPIDYYQVFLNGSFYQNIATTGKYVTGLPASTSYAVSVYAVDTSYNRSLISNIVNTATTNVANQVDRTGLVSYYKFDETSGTIANDSFGSDNLTNSGIAINNTGLIGKSYKSTGTNQRLETSTATPITTTFSVNIWIKRTASCPDYTGVFEYVGYATGKGFGIWMISNQISWIINSNYSHNIAATAIALNTWTMVTFTYDGANCKVYLNSVLKQTTANTTNPVSTTIKRLFYNANNSAEFNGELDECAIYNLALTQTQINNLYNSGIGITL